MNMLRVLFCGLSISIVAMSCQQIDDVFTSESPRDGYAKKMQDSPLAQKPIVQEWLAAGDSVLRNPVNVDMPFQTKMVYFNDEANAWAWQVSLPEGRTFRAHLALPDTSAQVFMDLFTMENGNPSLEKSAEDSMITHTLSQSQTLVLRVQAELLVDGSATLTMTDNPSMEFPVHGGIRADIGSFWGDPRDGGRRQHEGVDIFADRGTPVLAAADGRIARTGNGGLGGKTVWLRANGKSMYYAHLDSINSSMGQRVKTGDTLGFVGNTGNARTTPPHLHFGIYDRGATNPLPYIDFAHTRVEPITADPLPFPKWGRVAAAKANVRPLPSTEEAPLESLTQNNPVRMIGGSGEWFQVKLPDGREGFIYQSLLQPANSQLSTHNLSPGELLFKNYAASNPLFQTDSTLTIHGYGMYEDRHLVKLHRHWLWTK